MKKITLKRHSYHPAATVGSISIENKRGESDLIFHTIERPWLNNKPFKSCVPEGEYMVNPYSSEKFPGVYELQNVPGRTKILIHTANYASEVQGCIGLGLGIPALEEGKKHATPLMVLRSRNAMRRFCRIMKDESFILKIEQYKP